MAQSAEDLMGFIFQFINVLMGILIGFGALAVLTSVFGIVNTQSISVLERDAANWTHEGALGMRRRDVGRLFKFEAAWIGFLGGALGSGLAYLVGTLANPWISETLALGDSRLLVFQPLMFIGVGWRAYVCCGCFGNSAKPKGQRSLIRLKRSGRSRGFYARAFGIT